MKTTPSFSRRDFIHRAAGIAVIAAVQVGCGQSSVAGKRSRWTVACRDACLKFAGKPDCWAAMKELGVTGVEVTVTEDLACTLLHHPDRKYSVATDDGVEQLAADLAAHGVVITAFAMNNRFDEQLELEIAWAKRLVPAAEKLGIRAIRIDVVARKTSGDRFLPVAINVCKQICAIADRTSVRYGIENHGRTTNDPAFLDRLFDGVGSERLGLTLDALNFYWFGHPLEKLYVLYEKYASRVVHTHCKSARYPEDRRNLPRPIGWEYTKYAAPIYEGDIDYSRVAAILRKAGYQNDLCLESDSLGHFPVDQQLGVLKKEIRMLQSLV